MIINKFRTSNFKRITCVTGELQPDGNWVTGKNGEGKSSTIEALFHAFRPFTKTQIPEPIHKGENASQQLLELVDRNGKVIMTVERDQRANHTPQVIVKQRDGSLTNFGQDWLKTLVGDNLIELSDIERRTDDEWRDKILSLIPESSTDLARLDVEYNTAYATRTGLNAIKKKAEAAVKPIPEPVVVRDTKKITDNMIAQQEQVELYQRCKSDVEHWSVRIEQLKRDLKAAEGAFAQALERWSAMTDPTETYKQLAIDLENANNDNKRAKDYEDAVKLKHEAEDAIRNSENADSNVKSIEKARGELLKEVASKCPISGIGFDDRRVTIDGVPIKSKQIALSKLIQLEVALAIASIPKVQYQLPDGTTVTGLHTIAIKSAVALDSDSVAAIRQQCQAAGVQFILEDIIHQVYRSDPNGDNGQFVDDYDTPQALGAIIIEDGRNYEGDPQ